MSDRNEPPRSGIALERLMAVINERTTIQPRHRPAIQASLRAYRRAIEAEVMALYACGHLILGGKCSRPSGHAGAHSGEPEGKGG